MQHSRLLPLLLPLLVLAACREDQPLTVPAEPGGPVFNHTAGHKVVNSLADPGDGTCDATQCTLREAINAPGSTEISFAPGFTGPITLASPAAGGGPLSITQQLSITGPSQRIVIRRRSTDPAFRIFEILGALGPVTLSNLIIRGGKTSGSDRGSPGGGGGVILLEGDVLRLTNSVVAGNSATLAGGGILSFGTLTLTNSRVTGNSAPRAGGIVIAFSSARLTLTNSTVAGNSATESNAGGISNEGGTLTLTNSTVAGNTATRDGGGIAGGATLTNSTVSGNSARSGGGIAGGATLTNSTVSGNSATLAGGGILSFGTLTLTNSTVAGNTATQKGGGIANLGTTATLTLTNTLVTLNTADRGPDVLKNGGTVTARFSLLRIGNGSGVTNGVDGNQVGRQLAPLDPKLGPLADNGGPTRTHALQSGSSAIDAASTPDCPTTDQRGVLRPQGAACDIGSYERE